ncbi:MAG: FHA domain-containing protein [Propionibacteriaceae bacterium]|nr:FHA domain-containing protein [Propionibacteriaceae bacterium]
MGIFDAIERKLEGAVSGAFARTFKGDVQPVEITARLQKELDAAGTMLDKTRKLVPNHFLVTLSEHDFARLTPFAKTMNAEIIPVVSEYASNHDYVFNGPVAIEYAEDPKLPIGRFRVESSAVSEVNAEVAPPPPSYNALFVEVNGVRHPLTPPGLTVGRGNEVELRINDPGISREHARIEVEYTINGPIVTVTDLASTNGIKVNGRKVDTTVLNVGDVISLGKSELRVVA